MIEAASSSAPLPLTLGTTRTFEIPNRWSKLPSRVTEYASNKSRKPQIAGRSPWAQNPSDNSADKIYYDK